MAYPDTASLPQRGTAPTIFGPYLLRPNGCMDHDVTWYGARPRPRRLCVTWGPRSPYPKWGGPRSPFPNFRPISIVAKRWMDQDATWHEGRPQPRRLCIRWRHSYVPHKSPQRGWSPLPNFLPISIVAKRLDASRCHLVWM